MSAIATAIVGTAVVGAVVSDNASDKAARAQTRGAQAGIAEESRQFDAIRELLKPYVTAGDQSVAGMVNLLGLGTPEGEQAELSRIQQSPTFQTMVKQGEEGILSNASATGGLRGGNTQAALSEFRPSVLSSLINQRFSQYSDLSRIGQAAAAGQAAAGQNAAGNISGLYGQIGQAQAGRALAQGQNMSNLANTAGALGLMYATGGF